MTLALAPPWSGPFREPTAPAMALYVSVPLEDMARQTKVELLPPPCSAWTMSIMSSRWASSSV